MKIAIVGSRNFKDMKEVEYKLLSQFEYDFREHDIISGGASGVDSEVAKICREHRINFEEIKPDMSAGYDVAQYHLRNDKIIEKADKVIALWDGKSKGTESVILKCLQRHKDIEVVFQQSKKQC